MGLVRRGIPLEKRIIFALDVPSEREAREWVLRLKPFIRFYKVGLELFLASGFGIVDWILQQDCEVMLDLKLFDIPNTVRGAIERIRERGVTYTTVHGNDGILEAAVKAKGNLKVLAVTVLTSLDEGDLRDLGFQCNVQELVLSRARRALQLGCDGVVTSGEELKVLRERLGQGLIAVVPGVRPVSNRPVDDQKRVITPREAFLLGADHIVVGRPIRTSPNPEETARQMLDEAAEVLL
ncbi:MAG: orotidine-5'-phosphate decarboxylase [Deltaproteobacteria bacterium]|nr:MAG: orotidine-5'-phosphate decarboxylase [Deltaproteobacteria bacterium]